MSTMATTPRRRHRAKAVLRADFLRGLDALRAMLPATEYLGNLPWEGVPPDPAALDARTFLSWL